MKRVVAALCLLAAAACQRQPIGGLATQDLQARAGRIRAAVTAGDVDRVLAEVAALRQSLASWQQSGAIDEVRSTRILAAAEAVIQSLPLLSPEPVVSVEPEPSEEGEDRGKDRDRKRHSNDNGD